MTEHLFMKKVPVTVVQLGQESRKSNIFVSVEMDYITAPVSKKVVVIRLTDEKDLLFLYHMKMTEDEYRNFKEEKHLECGFDEFPHVLVEYLELCIAQDNDDDHVLFAQLTFNGAERAEFHVMQFVKLPMSDRMPKSITKNVKRDSILCLDFLKGTDNDVKCYLAYCLRLQQDQTSSLTKRITDMEVEFSETRSLLAVRDQELSGIASNYKEKVNDILAHHSEELLAEREKSQQVQSALQQRIDRDRKELEQCHLKIVKEWEARVREIDSSNRELTDSKYKLESSVRDLSMKLNCLEEENHRMRSDLQAVRTDYSALGSDRSEQEREVAQLKMKVAILEQEVRVKDEQLKRAGEDLQTERDFKRKVDEELERKRRQLREQAAIIKEKASDINKANEIIGRLQNENVSYYSEVKVRRMTIVEQEKVMNEKVQKLDELKHEVEAAQTALKSKDVEIQELKDKLEEFIQKLRESRDKIQKSEEVIQYLSRNVTEMQLHQRHPAGMFDMATRVPAPQSGPRIPVMTRPTTGLAPSPQIPITNVLQPYSSNGPNTAAATSRLSTPGLGMQSSPSAVNSGYRVSTSGTQVHTLVNNDIPVPVNKSTPVTESILKRTSPYDPKPSQHLREGLMDQKYFQSENNPPRMSVGSSALTLTGASDQMLRRTKDPGQNIPPSAAGRPTSRNAAEISNSSGQQPSLSSSYFPTRHS